MTRSARWIVALACTGWLAGCSPRSGTSVTVLRGIATTVDATREAIGFTGEKVAGPALQTVDVEGGWIVAGAQWWDGRSWHDRGPATCLQPGGDVPVELGVLEARPYRDAPGRGVVVWLKCLGASR
jgi:hypothetical protein